MTWKHMQACSSMSLVQACFMKERLTMNKSHKLSIEHRLNVTYYVSSHHSPKILFWSRLWYQLWNKFGGRCGWFYDCLKVKCKKQDGIPFKDSCGLGWAGMPGMTRLKPNTTQHDLTQGTIGITWVTQHDTIPHFGWQARHDMTQYDLAQDTTSTTRGMTRGRPGTTRFLWLIALHRPHCKGFWKSKPIFSMLHRC